LVIDKNLAIIGPGADRLTVQRDTSVILARVFHISSSTVTVSISGITISHGYSQNGPGGGGVLSAGILTLTGCTISDNSGSFSGGGGVMNDNGTMTITSCTISNNIQGGDVGGGGGVLNANGTMTITDCTISNNIASQPGFAGGPLTAEGGGILNDSGGSLIITNSTISGNICSATGVEPTFQIVALAYGGGIDNNGSITITNCTISGNSAVANGFTSEDTGYGGGISNSGDLQITSSTIAHNSASGDDFGVGGGINGFEPTRADSSIIALNTASTRGPDYYTNGRELLSTGYNIIGNNADAVINSQPTDQIGTPTVPIDPLLGPLADNGGPTLTHALQAGSPAINRGDPAAPPQDQRDYDRLGVPDVGAFEFNGVPPTILGNISTRAFVQTGDNVMIGGFIVEGAQPKRVIIRAIGPELTRYGVPNPLFNPTLELHDGTEALIASNDNWQHTIIGGIITANQVRDIRSSGHAPTDGRESAIIADLPLGHYTAIVRGVDNMTGVALAEVYDISGNAISTLGNISTRSFVQTGDNVMIGGFMVQGTEPKKVILRAIGPELTQHGVPNVLVDPTLELHDSTGALIASNDSWLDTIIGGIITGDQVRDIRNSGHAPTDSRESAIIADLPGGNYTAIVRGVNNTTGVALVEVYDLDQ